MQEFTRSCPPGQTEKEDRQIEAATTDTDVWGGTHSISSGVFWVLGKLGREGARRGQQQPPEAVTLEKMYLGMSMADPRPPASRA